MSLKLPSIRTFATGAGVGVGVAEGDVGLELPQATRPRQSVATTKT
jgi:hypothetical protein